MTEKLSIIGVLLSAISIFIAVYQYQDKKKFQYLIKSNCWMVFQRINNLGGTIQNAYNEANATNLEKTLYEKIVRCDALAAELLKEAIRLIIISERNVTTDDVNRWENEGKITGGYSELFKKYLADK